MKRALIAQCLNLNRLYIILLHHPLTHHVSFYLQLVTAVLHCCTSMQLFRTLCILLTSSVERREVTLLGRSPSFPCTFFTVEAGVLVIQHYCCCSPSPRAPGPGPRGGFWLRARGPCQQARNDGTNNLQMLACIRAWQLVMSPPTRPHSSITSHLLPDTSWGRWRGNGRRQALDCTTLQPGGDVTPRLRLSGWKRHRM